MGYHLDTLASNGKIYAKESRGAILVAIDPASETVVKLPHLIRPTVATLPHLRVRSIEEYYEGSGIRRPDGTVIFLTPYLMVSVDPDTDIITQKQNPFGLLPGHKDLFPPEGGRRYTVGPRAFHGVGNGKIYEVTRMQSPYGSERNRVLEYDLNEMTYKQVGP